MLQLCLSRMLYMNFIILIASFKLISVHNNAYWFLFSKLRILKIYIFCLKNPTFVSFWFSDRYLKSWAYEELHPNNILTAWPVNLP